jgi:hypothetical protein
MDNDDARQRWRGGEAALGGLLVLLGLVVLLGQAVDLEVGRVAWPVFVIVPGLVLLGRRLLTARRP